MIVYGDQLAERLAIGLADNWSQVCILKAFAYILMQAIFFVQALIFIW